MYRIEKMRNSTTTRLVTYFVLLGALFLLALALFYRPLMLVIMGTSEGAAIDPLDLYKREQISGAWAAFVVAALPLFGIAFLAMVQPSFKRWLGRGTAMNLILLTVTLYTAISSLEIGLAPLRPPRHTQTTIYQKDDQLGWKMRPNANDRWKGVPVQVNANGMRGPNVPLQRGEKECRLLYLGDSVTFGFGLPLHHTYPSLVEESLSISHDCNITTVNMAVGGYATWQENLVFQETGVRYDPDLVIIGFVLNDVTDKYNLRRFGGRSEAYQLESSKRVASFLRRNSNIYDRLQDIIETIRFGRDKVAGAERIEELRAGALFLRPDRPEIQRAWVEVLKEMKEIVDRCHSEKIPALLVVLPMAKQLNEPVGFAGPQAKLRQFAIQNQVGFLDLLPVFTAESRTEQGIGRIFLDRVHLTSEGSRIAASKIAEEISKSGYCATCSEN